MATRTYNTFYTWIGQDEFLSWWANLIEWYNVTWLSTWYGLTLWWKSNKLFTTNWAMRGLFIKKQSRTTDNTENFAFWDGWEIYRFDSSDLTPIYTTTNQLTLKGLFEVSDKYYFLQEIASWDARCDLWRSEDNTFTDVADIYIENEWESNEESYDSFISNTDVFPVLESETFTYLWWASKIARFSDDNTPTINTYNIYSKQAQGLASQGSSIYIYTSNQEVIVWDWTSTAIDWSNMINFPVRRIKQLSDRIYTTSRDWELRLWNSYQFSKIVKTVVSDRQEDNSSFQTKFDFGGWDDVIGQYIANVWESIYIGCNDTIPWIYIYDNILEWTTKGLHKAITTNHEWTAIDNIYAIEYDHTQDRVFYSYKAWTTYWVDFINVRSRETQQYGYAVTDVFSANTSMTKKQNLRRIAVSNTSWNNYIKVYTRVNNWDWELARTINESDDTIRAIDLKSVDWARFKENADIQFKFELYNDTQWENWPIIHEFMYDYDIIKI